MRADKLFLKMHLEKLESIAELDTADFIPPVNATLVPEQPVVLDPTVLVLDYVLHQEMPHYPASIRPPGGQAIMKFTIGKDGRVTSVQFVEGTLEMKKALEEALKKSVYGPFVVRGEPVEVEVQQKFGYEIFKKQCDCQVSGCVSRGSSKLTLPQHVLPIREVANEQFFCAEKGRDLHSPLVKIVFLIGHKSSPLLL